MERRILITVLEDRYALVMYQVQNRYLSQYEGEKGQRLAMGEEGSDGVDGCCTMCTLMGEDAGS